MWIRTKNDGMVNLANARTVQLLYPTRKANEVQLRVDWGDRGVSGVYDLPDWVNLDDLNTIVVPAEPGLTALVCYVGSGDDTERPTYETIHREKARIVAWRVSGDRSNELAYPEPILDVSTGGAATVLYQLPETLHGDPGDWVVAEFDGVSGKLRDVLEVKLSSAQQAWDEARARKEAKPDAA